MRAQGLAPPSVLAASRQSFSPSPPTSPGQDQGFGPVPQIHLSPSPTSSQSDQILSPQPQVPRGMPAQPSSFRHRSSASLGSRDLQHSPHPDYPMSGPAEYQQSPMHSPPADQHQFSPGYTGSGMYQSFVQQPPYYQGAAAQYYGELSPQTTYLPRTPSPGMPWGAPSSEHMNVSPSPAPSNSAYTPVNDPAMYLQVQRGLLDLHRVKGTYPSVKILNGEVIRDGHFPVAGGAYSDVWVGRWLGEYKVSLDGSALRSVNTNPYRLLSRPFAWCALTTRPRRLVSDITAPVRIHTVYTIALSSRNRGVVAA
jgi:hypothetical protein